MVRTVGHSVTPYKKYGHDKLYQDFLKQLEEGQILYCGYLNLKKISKEILIVKRVQDVMIQHIDISLS